MTRRPGLLLLLLLWIALPVRAITINDLYESAVAVPDQSGAVRRDAIVAALRQVLIKLTGDSNAPQRQAMSAVLGRAEDYVQQYRYLEVESTAPAASTVPSGASAAPAKELRLWVRFDESSLDRNLYNLGIPLWGKERPATLLWLVLDDSQGRDWITPDQNPRIQALITATAAARGIAVLAPLHDLQDAAALQTSDVWAGFAEPVIQASARYQADAIFTGACYSPVPGIWEGRWIAHVAGQAQTWTTDGDLLDVVVEEGIDGLANLLAARYVPRGSGGVVEEVSITVADIGSVEQYARVLRYLESLSSVTKIQVTEVEPEKVSLLLTAHGGRSALDQAFALGRVLERLKTGSGDLYRLLP